MKYQDIFSQILIFLASISSTLYLIFSKEDAEKEEIKRKVLAGKILGAVIVAFFVMPAIMEYFSLSIKATLLFTVIVAYGLESLLKASVKLFIKQIDKDGEDVANN